MILKGNLHSPITKTYYALYAFTLNTITVIAVGSCLDEKSITLLNLHENLTLAHNRTRIRNTEVLHFLWTRQIHMNAVNTNVYELYSGVQAKEV